METKKCPHCGEEILAVAKKCKYCGEWLEVSGEASSNTMVCPTCGETIPKDIKVCPVCKESINPTHASAKIDGKRNVSIRKYVLIGGGFICAIGIFLYIFREPKHTVISEDPISDTSEYYSGSEAVEEVMKLSEADFVNNWEVGHFKDSFGEEDMSAPYISQRFTTDKEPINITIGKNGFMMEAEYFPVSRIEEITIKEHDGTLTSIPCEGEYHRLITTDQNGYISLVRVLDKGMDFTIRLKVWSQFNPNTEENEYYYSAYKVNGYLGQGVKMAIQNHLIN